MLWLLVVLSIISVAIMIERAWYFATHRLDLESLGTELRRLLTEGQPSAARALVERLPTVQGQVLAAGLGELERGADAVGEAMVAAKARMRPRLERGLSFLGTLGSNAPFIGLFGTVLGIIKAFHDLAANQAGGAGVVMAGISEALVATAVGLLVAIPAVVGFNFFNRRVRATMASSDALAHLLLAHLRGDAEEAASAMQKRLSEVK